MSSLFEKIGGKEAVNAAVDVFYNRVIKSIEKLNTILGMMINSSSKIRQTTADSLVNSDISMS